MSKIKNISTQEDWDSLLGLISEGILTPVIGNEMYKYSDNGDTHSLDEYLSKKLLEKFDATDQTFTALTNTVNYLVNEKKTDIEAVIEFVHDAIEKIKFDFPLLTDLLEISDLKYFINTTVFYDILERKIEDVRNEKTDHKDFSPYSLFPECPGPEKLNNPFVFNVFGSLLKDAAISDEEMLEFISQLNEKMSTSPNLINTLQNNNLLFLGCAYPEWMIRFVLRLLTLQPLNEWGSGKPRRKIYIINDKTAFRDEVYKILKNYNVITFEQGTAEFLTELSNQWNNKFASPKSIFLSYTRGDKEAVENLKKGLEQISNLKCWYDKEDLEIAVRWREEIIRKINKADLFIPLISNNSLEHKGFVEKEWDAAFNNYVVRGKTGDYIIPLVVDNTDPYDSRVPKDFTDLNIKTIPQGNPDEPLIKRIKDILKLD